MWIDATNYILIKKMAVKLVNDIISTHSKILKNKILILFYECDSNLYYIIIV